MSTSSTEKELLALLRQRDADLEERGRLLLKTKVAIEQLQQELSASRKEEEVFKEEARKAYEEQLGQARAIQAQLQLCEEELEARTQDLTRYAAENRNIELRNAELEGELDRVREEANRQITDLEAGNQEQALAAQQQGQELQARRREVATLEAKLHSRSGVLAGHSERAKQLQQERDDSEQLVRELMRKTKKLQEDQAAAEQSLKASAAEVQQAQQRLQQVQAAATSGSQAAQSSEKEWQQKLQQQEQQWAHKQQLLEKHWAARLVEAQRLARAQKAAVEEAQQQQVNSLQASQAKMTRQLQLKAQQTDWQAANEKALLEKHWAGKVAEAEAASQEKASQLERQWQGRLEKAQGEWQTKLNEGQLQWAQDRAAAELAWKQAKAEAEEQWQQQLQSLQQTHRRDLAAGQAAAAQGRAGVEAKLGALTNRLLHMARKEAKREKRRGELIRAVEELRQGAGAENGRRRELEAALRESAAIFKHELHDKNLELAALQQQLMSLRAWQGQTLEVMSQDLLHSMQSSPESAQRGWSQGTTSQRPTPRQAAHVQHPPAVHIRQPPQGTALRSLSYPLATPLATPHWLQSGAFQTPANSQRHPSAPPQAAPQAQELRQGHSHRAFQAEPSQAALRPDAGATESSGQAELEAELQLLSGNGMEEEVLVQELQALQAARQDLHHASQSEERLRKSLLSRIADKLEQPEGPAKLATRSKSRAHFQDTIPAERSAQAEVSEPHLEARSASEAAPSSWQPLTSHGTVEGSNVQQETEHKHDDSSHLQSWNDELTQRLNAVMQKVPDLLPQSSEARRRADRRHSAVT